MLPRRQAAGVGLLVFGGLVTMLAGIWPVLSLDLPIPYAGLVVAGFGAACVVFSVYLLSDDRPPSAETDP